MELFPQGSKPLTGVSPLVKALGGEVGHFLRRDGKIVNLAAQTNLTFQWRQILPVEKYLVFWWFTWLVLCVQWAVACPGYRLSNVGVLLFYNVLQCLTVSYNVLQCLTMSYTVLHCLTMSAM